ncbi:hypothetical protein SDC9_155370 [bioreactor metagenome]|uniref:Uncharacterized protein n=1 Tax=bioreactor metagenome TaxID=1076179 RepID=A0A645F6J1_9ZZZZ
MLGVFARIEFFHLAARMVGDNGLSVELNQAVRRVIDAGHTVESRRLARAVRADERDDFALIDLQRKIVDSDNAAELHGYIFKAQYILRH